MGHRAQPRLRAPRQRQARVRRGVRRIEIDRRLKGRDRLRELEI